MSEDKEEFTKVSYKVGDLVQIRNATNTGNITATVMGIRSVGHYEFKTKPIVLAISVGENPKDWPQGFFSSCLTASAYSAFDPKYIGYCVPVALSEILPQGEEPSKKDSIYKAGDVVQLKDGSVRRILGVRSATSPNLEQCGQFIVESSPVLGGHQWTPITLTNFSSIIPLEEVPGKYFNNIPDEEVLKLATKEQVSDYFLPKYRAGDLVRVRIGGLEQTRRILAVRKPSHPEAHKDPYLVETFEYSTSNRLKNSDLEHYFSHIPEKDYKAQAYVNLGVGEILELAVPDQQETDVEKFNKEKISNSTENNSKKMKPKYKAGDCVFIPGKKFSYRIVGVRNDDHPHYFERYVLTSDNGISWRPNTTEYSEILLDYYGHNVITISEEKIVGLAPDAISAIEKFNSIAQTLTKTVEPSAETKMETKLQHKVGDYVTLCASSDGTPSLSGTTRKVFKIVSIGHPDYVEGMGNFKYEVLVNHNGDSSWELYDYGKEKVYLDYSDYHMGEAVYRIHSDGFAGFNEQPATENQWIDQECTARGLSRKAFIDQYVEREVPMTDAEKTNTEKEAKPYVCKVGDWVRLKQCKDSNGQIYPIDYRGFAESKVVGEGSYQVISLSSHGSFNVALNHEIKNWWVPSCNAIGPGTPEYRIGDWIEIPCIRNAREDIRPVDSGGPNIRIGNYSFQVIGVGRKSCGSWDYVLAIPPELNPTVGTGAEYYQERIEKFDPEYKGFCWGIRAEDIIGYGSPEKSPVGTAVKTGEKKSSPPEKAAPSKEAQKDSMWGPITKDTKIEIGDILKHRDNECQVIALCDGKDYDFVLRQVGGWGLIPQGKEGAHGILTYLDDKTAQGIAYSQDNGSITEIKTRDPKIIQELVVKHSPKSPGYIPTKTTSNKESKMSFTYKIGDTVTTHVNDAGNISSSPTKKKANFKVIGRFISGSEVYYALAVGPGMGNVFTSHERDFESINKKYTGNSVNIQEKCIVSKQSFFEDLVETSKSDAKKALVRTGARRMTRETRDMMVMACKAAGLSPSAEKKIIKRLNTEEGLGLISIFMGLLSKYSPGLKENPVAQQFSKEFRVEGISTEMGAVLDRFSTSFVMMAAGRVEAIKEGIKAVEGTFTEDLMATTPRTRVAAQPADSSKKKIKVAPVQLVQNDTEEAEDDVAEVEAVSCSA